MSLFVCRSGGVSFKADGAGSDNACSLEAYTGALHLEGGRPVTLHFDLVFTPNKPLNTSQHFRQQRYYQMESQLVPSSTLLDGGVDIVNIHQGNPYNPWIICEYVCVCVCHRVHAIDIQTTAHYSHARNQNISRSEFYCWFLSNIFTRLLCAHTQAPYTTPFADPLDPVANAASRAFASRMHKGGSRVKTYYSSGSLSFITPELWAFFSLYDEVIAPHLGYVDPIPPPLPPHVTQSTSTKAMAMETIPAFGPHHWFSEHAATAAFSSDWTTPLSHVSTSPVCMGCDMDVSFTTRANSRLANFWSRLLVLATQELDLDGIYLDGVAYDAPTMLRAMRAVSSGRGDPQGSGGMLDLHCGNRWPSGKGEIDVLEYAQHMSLMDSVMFGEGFDDGGTHPCTNINSGVCGDAEWMLLATSGLQFGVMNDMLTDINVHRGMVFGMWARPPYSALDQNSHLWAWIDSSGLADNNTEMIGFWADEDDWHTIVHTGHPDIKATAYIVQPINLSDRFGHLIIALASWSSYTTTFALTLDTDAIASKLRGWTDNMTVGAPSITSVQGGSVAVPWNGAHPSKPMQLSPRSGVLLTVYQAV